MVYAMRQPVICGHITFFNGIVKCLKVYIMPLKNIMLNTLIEAIDHMLHKCLVELKRLQKTINLFSGNKQEQ